MTPNSDYPEQENKKYMKEKNDLMKPRYKVTDRWPGMQLHVNTVYNSEQYIQGGKCYDCKDYPALFKPLQWWEERSPDEMPEYVKEEDTRIIRRFKETSDEYTIFLFDNPGEVEYDERVYSERDGKGYEPYPIVDLVPATETEYLNYLKTISK